MLTPGGGYGQVSLPPLSVFSSLKLCTKNQLVGSPAVARNNARKDSISGIYTQRIIECLWEAEELEGLEGLEGSH